MARSWVNSRSHSVDPEWSAGHGDLQALDSVFHELIIITYRGCLDMIRTLVLSLVLVTPCLVGCGGSSGRPDLFKVTGTVTFKGAPVEGATVSFASDKARSATGVTDANGKFSLMTFDTNDGAIAGEHSVTIIKAASEGSAAVITQENAMEMMAKNMGTVNAGQKQAAEAKPNYALPAKYADAKTSGEKRTVSSVDSNDFKLDLTE